MMHVHDECDSHSIPMNWCKKKKKKHNRENERIFQTLWIAIESIVMKETKAAIDHYDVSIQLWAVFCSCSF